MRKARVIAAACCVATLVGCAPEPAPSPAPTSPPVQTPTGSPSPSTTPTKVDLTVPGAATAALQRLVAAAGTSRVLMVSLTASDASVTVLRNGAAETWALRGGDPRRVESDTTYVSQAVFDVDGFDVADLGALFRTASAVSGSAQRQELQIVDYSAGLVMMSVSTNPESRTVFFRADGTLLPTLDLDSEWGLAEGLRDAVDGRSAVHSVAFGNPLGVYADVPGREAGTVLRRQRTARVPVVVTPRPDANPPTLFDPQQVKPAAVERVLSLQRTRGTWTPGTEWTCVVEQRAGTTEPRLYFQLGPERFVTDLDGHRLEG